MKLILQTLTLIMSLALFTACDNNDSSDIQIIANDSSDAQTIVDDSPDAQTIAIDKIKAYAQNGGVAPTLQDYLDAGVVGVTEANLAEINEIVYNLTPDEVDTKEEIQEIVNNIGAEGGILTKRVHYLNGVCKVYIDKNGTDTNNNGILEDSEVTSTTDETFTNGTPITLEDLKAKIAAVPMEDITSVNTCQITDMLNLLIGKSDFNQDISSWNTGAVTNMQGMFAYATVFNQNIGTWDTASVITMANMFEQAFAFNQDIGAWKTGAVKNTTSMFSAATAFNQDIGRWNTGNVTDMSYMFLNAIAFNQNLNDWNVSKVLYHTSFDAGSALINANLPIPFQVP